MPSNHENEYMVNLSMNTRGSRPKPDRGIHKLMEVELVRVYSNKTSKLLTELNVSKHITVGEFKEMIEQKTGLTVLQMHDGYLFPYTPEKPNSRWSGNTTELLFKSDTVNLNEVWYPFMVSIDTEDPTASTGT